MSGGFFIPKGVLLVGKFVCYTCSMAAPKIPSRNQSILERRLIELTLQETAKDWEKNNNRLYRKYNFDSPDFFTSQSFTVTDTTLIYEHLLKTRFIDMKRINGNIKKNYPIHNAQVFGYFFGIIKDLQTGYTQEVQQMLANDINLEL